MLRSHNFIERSIAGVLSFFKESLFAEEHAVKRGLLQPLDSRVKMLTLFAFVICAVILKNVYLITWLYLLSLLLVTLSKIDLLFFLRRTWIFIPLFSLFIAFPALFSFVSPGEPILIFSLGRTRLVITQQGLEGAVLFVMRVITCVSFVVLLGLVTRHTVLLRVLRIFRIPQIFVMVLGMSYRYIYLFTETIERAYLGMKSRVGPVRLASGKGQRLVAGEIATLWVRANGLNEEVYLAMLSRGFSGEPVVWDEMKMKTRDGVWIFVSAVIICLLFYLN